MADLYTITLKAGTVLRYTTWDSSLTVSGSTFLTGPPNIERTAIEEQLGMDVSTIEVTIAASATDLISGVPILQAIGLGLFDGAAFKIERLFMDSNGQQIGTVIRFAGFIGPVDELTRSYAKITVNSGTELLSMQLPAIILQPGCTNTLFDARCGMSKSNLLQFSEQFDNPSWSRGNVTVALPTVTANNAIDPLGGNTADTITFPAVTSGTESYIFSNAASIAGSGARSLTFSVWLRVPSGTAVVHLNMEDAPVFAFVPSSFPTVTTVWQRFSVTGTYSGTGSVASFIIADQIQGAFNLQVWGAQMEYGPNPTAYQPTTTGIASFSEPNTVQAGSTVNKLISVSGKADSYFDNGQIAFTSGANAGLVKAVRQYLGQQFTFNSPLPFVPTAGDTFIAYPGCDKTQATCTTKFSNLVNFEGFPYVPVPETAI